MVRKLCSGLRLRGLHKTLRLRTMYHLTFSGSCRAGTDRLRWISDRFLLVLPAGPAVFLRWTLRFSVQHQRVAYLQLKEKTMINWNNAFHSFLLSLPFHRIS